MMAQQQHPTSLDISKDDYSVEIFCGPRCLHLENKSMPYTRLPHEVTFKIDVQILLVSSSSDSKEGIHYQWTHEKVSMPSHEVFSDDRCRQSVKNLILDLRPGPLSLNKRKLQWTAEERDSAGRVIDREKSLEDSEELVSELAEYIQKIRDSPPLALEELGFKITIKKLVSQPDSVIETWRSWCLSARGEYHDFVVNKPMNYACRLRQGLKALEKMRQRRGDFDEAEKCCICLEELSKSGRDGGLEVARLPCCHVYHESCLLAWLSITLSCPYCRAEVPRVVHHL